jgi:hypothetical protein
MGHSDPVIELGRMTDVLGDDSMMLDEWEGEGKREERDHGKHIFLERFLFFFFFFFSRYFFPFSVCRIDVCDARRL